MGSVQVETYVGEDGIVLIKLPGGIKNVRATVAVSFDQPNKRTRKEWEEFVDKFYGIQANDPIERPEQLEYEIRGEIE